MLGLFQKREKLHRESMRRKKELKLAPGYLTLILQIPSTLALLGWALLASFSTTRKISSNKLLDSGFHIENYVKAWVNLSTSTIFFNSLFYAAVFYTLPILVCAPAAYAPSRFDSVCDKLTQPSLVASMGVPIAIVVSSLSAMMTGLSILNNTSANQTTLIFLYTGVNMPYTIILLTTFFANPSRTFEEATIIGGRPLVKTFWLIIPSMARPRVVIVTIFNFINIRSEYLISLIFGNSDKVCPVAVGLYSMTDPMKYTGDWVGIFSIVVIALLPIFTLYVLPLEKIIVGVTGGGMEGQDRIGNVKE